VEELLSHCVLGDPLLDRALGGDFDQPAVAEVERADDRRGPVHVREELRRVWDRAQVVQLDSERLELVVLAEGTGRVQTVGQRDVDDGRAGRSPRSEA
jgi:hypothetical protein